jgi:hypothetical protein
MYKYFPILVLGLLTFSCTKDKAINNANKMVIAPNPFQNVFSVNVHLNKVEPFTLKVYNANGNLIKDVIINTNQLNNGISINASTEKEGLFYVVADIPSGKLSQKILKLKP